MFDKLMTYIESENYVYALIAIAISLAYNAFRFLDAYHAHRKRRVLDLENTIKSRHISAIFKKYIREEIESEYFKQIYGVKTKKKCIDEIFSIHGMINNRISFTHFIRAARLQPNIFDLPDTMPKRLKPDIMEAAFGVYHLFFGGIFFICGSIYTIYNIAMIGTIALTGIAPFVASIFFTVTGWVMLYLGAPIYSVRIINLELKRLDATVNTR